VFPALSIRPSRFRFARLREVTGFSIYVSIIDWANRLNYSIDAVIIGAFMTPAAVALWAVPQRIAEFLQRLTNQLNGVLFPVVVESDAVERADRLRTIFVQGTLLSLFAVVPLTVALFLLSGALIQAWVGPQFAASGPITQILVIVIAFRVGNATATTVLKGANRHQMLAFTNAATAMANVALSLLWIRRYGLIGQAFGTLVPVALSSVFVLFPAACRRVDISIGRAFRKAVWPALWPIVIMMAAIVSLRAVLPPALPSLVLITAAGSLVYAAAFLGLAIGRDERQTYVAKLHEILRRRRATPTVAAAIRRTA
jgi:O-antigen/teichoic acid export membrane protein